MTPGDGRLFAELYRRFRPFVGAVLARRHVFSHDADDVMQSVFTAILASLVSSDRADRYDPRMTWTEYLAGVTLRELSSARKSAGRARAVGGTDHAAVIAALPAASGGGPPPPDAAGAAAEIAAAVAADEPARLAALLPHIEAAVRARMGKTAGRYPALAALASGRIDTDGAIKRLAELEKVQFNRKQVNMAVSRFRKFAREAAEELGCPADAPAAARGP